MIIKPHASRLTPRRLRRRPEGLTPQAVKDLMDSAAGGQRRLVQEYNSAARHVFGRRAPGRSELVEGPRTRRTKDPKDQAMTRTAARTHAAWVALDAIAALEVDSPAYSPREREQVYAAVEDLKDRLRLTIRRWERTGQKIKLRR